MQSCTSSFGLSACQSLSLRVSRVPLGHVSCVDLSISGFLASTTIRELQRADQVILPEMELQERSKALVERLLSLQDSSDFISSHFVKGCQITLRW